MWEGLRLLQEIRYGSPLTWVYTDQHGYEPLAQIRGVKDPEILWYHCHPNGTPERLTDKEGNLCWHGHNSAWGKLLREERLSGPYYTDNLRMQGQYLDRETGLHYNLFRNYDPDCGRFTQPDPIGLAGGLNLYQYAPNALGWVDPLGLSGEDIFIHYTNKRGVESIMQSGVINANAKGKVYVTDILMTPKDVMRDLLINNPRYSADRGDYAIIFKADLVQLTNIEPSSRLEYIHHGSLKLKSVLYSGKNPYSNLSVLDYETRLKISDNQVNSRGCKK